MGNYVYNSKVSTVDDITLDEIEKVVKGLNSKKTTESDGINAELFK